MPTVTLNRIPPLMSARNYKTYGFSRPLSTHWQAATCEDVDCKYYVNGWTSEIDESTADGKIQAHFIRHDKTRSYTESKGEMGKTRFTYTPGNMCFYQNTHRQPIERLPKYYVRGGDWRGNPLGTPTRIHRSPEQWVEDLAEHQDRLATLVGRG